jgi:hypothetical protein
MYYYIVDCHPDAASWLWTLPYVVRELADKVRAQEEALAAKWGTGLHHCFRVYVSSREDCAGWHDRKALPVGRWV